MGVVSLLISKLIQLRGTQSLAFELVNLTRKETWANVKRVLYALNDTITHRQIQLFELTNGQFRPVKNKMRCLEKSYIRERSQQKVG